jgi:hypothetical protein
MKIFIFSALLVFSPLGMAGFPAPDATYSGEGQMTNLSGGTNSTYAVSYVISGNSVTATYKFSDESSYTLPFTTTMGQFGKFTVEIQGQVAGSGYCIGNSCQVSASYPLNGTLQQVSLEFTYEGNQSLIISGRNTTANTIWEDDLSSKSGVLKPSSLD